MSPKYQPKRQAPKRGSGKPPRSSESDPDKAASRAARYDEDGFLKKAPDAAVVADQFAAAASNSSGGNGSAQSKPAPTPNPAPKKREFDLEPQEFNFGPSAEDRFTRGRKLGGAIGEDFWSDPERSGKPSWTDGPNRKDPFSSSPPNIEDDSASKRRTRQVPRTEAIRPDHIEPVSREDLPDASPRVDLLERQARTRGGPRPRHKPDLIPDSEPDPSLEPRPASDQGTPTIVAAGAVDSHRQARSDRNRLPENDLEPIESFGSEEDRKLSRRERKQLRVIEEQQQQTLGQWFKEITLLGIVAIGTAILLTTYLVQAFFIPSISMENTLMVNDRVLVNKAAYKFSEPQYNDIIVFISPDGNLAPPPPDTPYGRFMDKLAIGIGLKSSEQDLIKRVIATEGQTIEVRVGVVFVDGKQLDESYRKDDNPMQDVPPNVVPENHVFVLGDNRSNSGDSRSFGPVDEEKIIGKAFARIWPMERVQILK